MSNHTLLPLTITYQLLDEIAEKFYGVQRRNSMPGGMFGEIFKVIPTPITVPIDLHWMVYSCFSTLCIYNFANVCR